MSEIITPRGNLEENLLDTLTWCNPKYAIFVKPQNLEKLYRGDILSEYAKRISANDENYKDIIDHFQKKLFGEFLRERKNRLQQIETFSKEAVSSELSRPKSLLIFAYDETVWDGAGENVSKGFIDVWDTPPWDTWVDLAKGASGTKYLISWVPRWATKYVDKAIEVNCVECLAWAHYSDGKLTRISNE